MWNFTNNKAWSSANLPRKTMTKLKEIDNIKANRNILFLKLTKGLQQIKNHLFIKNKTKQTQKQTKKLLNISYEE